MERYEEALELIENGGMSRFQHPNIDSRYIRLLTCIGVGGKKRTEAIDELENFFADGLSSDKVLQYGLLLSWGSFETKKHINLERLWKNLTSIEPADPMMSGMLYSNMGHYWMSAGEYGKALECYQRVLGTGERNSRLVPDMVIANFCASLIQSDRSDEAEKLMADLAVTRPSTLIVVNILVGQLYCLRGDWGFGISRILELPSKMDVETWYFVKEIILELCLGMSEWRVDRETFQDGRVFDFLVSIGNECSNSDNVRRESEIVGRIFKHFIVTV
jgi:tetratricopeptide (TPR) repeat protein